MIRFKATPKIKELRSQKKYTQQHMASVIAVAENISYDRSSYAQIEDGINSVSLDRALLIAQTLKENLEELFTKSEYEETE